MLPPRPILRSRSHAGHRGPVPLQAARQPSSRRHRHLQSHAWEPVLCVEDRRPVASTRRRHVPSGPFNVAPAANFACFLPGRPQALWWSHAAGTSANHYHGLDLLYMDVTIHQGKMFAIGWNGDLFLHEFLIGEAAPSQSRVEHVIRGQHMAAHAKYHLVTSSDSQKLLMVSWRIADVVTDHHTMSLHVFEADLDKGQWLEVKDMSDQVLFVGMTGSRALAVGGSSEQYHRSFQGGNRVFVLGSDWAWVRAMRRAAPCRCSDCRKLVDGIPSYCVYDMKNGKTSLVSLFFLRGV